MKIRRIAGLCGLGVVPVFLAGASAIASPSSAGPASAATAPTHVLPLWSVAPFVLMLLAIAIVPLIRRCHRFWERNRNKLLVALVLSALTLLYYYFLHPSVVGMAGEVSSRLELLQRVLSHAIIEAYIPFIVLLLALYTISGGIRLEGDLPAHPRTNAAFLAAGGILASFIGTTGAAMLLIRPLLDTNAERRHVRHTIIFFIMIVCNIGGCLLPIGDPPLFLGYLRGVPFLWTLRLTVPWAFTTAVLVLIYYIWDCIAYRREKPEDIAIDEAARRPLALKGKRNFLYLLGVVLATGLLIPGKPFVLMPSFLVPEHLREAVLLCLVALSLATTPRDIRRANQFTFSAMAEVAALFLGIFITMQAPLEILRVKGPSMGLTQPWQFFWATGSLSSFLDNAPTYLVFFEIADSLTRAPGAGILQLFGGNFIRTDLLAALSLGAVFMGANTYIGNGPNFMVKTIAEQRGIKMPSFFGYMLYSIAILIPLFLLVTVIFFLR
jgi:Na+/H+ antiporter NhaD/arsenite permease-like protein